MFYRKGRTADTYLYIILDWNIFFLTIFCILLRRNFKVLSYNVFFGRNALNKYNMFSNSKSNRLNNRVFNIDRNNRDYDFSHNRAALVYVCVCVSGSVCPVDIPPTKGMGFL